MRADRQVRRGGDKLLRVGMLGRSEYRLRGTLLDDLATVEHGDTVAELPDDREVV